MYRTGWARAGLRNTRARLERGQRLHREQVMDLLWPEDTIAEAAPTLHKAVHFARRAYEPPGRGGRTTIP